ncbi:hypothetical protein KUTeg_011700 [Tegillarca granosa]|uniref:S1 motif domain-containing protein n=1 Tax=Tegillarca granosa TaxID=220873 RepID=A0ABQ9F127_TEGGR|nr:hypothetical protein KUTeg_011700 [Tegillarca granosa]
MTRFYIFLLHKSIEKRDIIIGVVSSVTESGLVLLLLCMDDEKARDIDDFRISAFCPVKELPRQFMHQNPIENFQVKDKVRGVVLSVNAETEKIIVSMMERALPENVDIKLGLVNEDEFPVHYRRKLHIRGLTFDELLHSILGFNNAGNIKCLMDVLSQSEEASLMRGLHNKQIPEKEMCEHLRKQQSANWAHSSVAQGIALFKSGKFMEAMQHLNRALQIDSTNVEALVARGALYANNDSYTKAIEDFEVALSINPEHKNAKKYMIETLLAQGRIHEDQSRYEESEAFYKQALTIDPESIEVREALRYMMYKKAREENDRNPGSFLKIAFDEEKKTNSKREIS